MIQWLRKLILKALGIDEYDERIKDVERHFITKRDISGATLETLADVPVSKRGELRKPRLAGMNALQRRAILEATDGGTRAPVAEKMPSTS